MKNLTPLQALDNIKAGIQDPSLKLSQQEHLTLLMSVQTIEDYLAEQIKKENIKIDNKIVESEQPELKTGLDAVNELKLD